MAARATRLPIVVKGILTAEDALLAMDSGVGGIIVSNHGGRQLDGATRLDRRAAGGGRTRSRGAPTC